MSRKKEIAELQDALDKSRDQTAKTVRERDEARDLVSVLRDELETAATTVESYIEMSRGVVADRDERLREAGAVIDLLKRDLATARAESGEYLSSLGFTLEQMSVAAGLKP